MKRMFLAALAAIALFCPGDAWAQSTVVPNWGVNHTPAVNVQATASTAALAKTRHVATSCSGSISTVAAQVAITLSLRDGATGAGTVIWSETITCPITSPCVLSSPPLNVAGSTNTAMTCEWSGIPSVGNFEVANLHGYDIGAN